MERGNIERLVDIKGDGKTSLVVTILKGESGEKVVCLFNANDPRGDYREPCDISVNVGFGKIERAFSLKNPDGESVDGKYSLAAGDAVFLVVR